MELIKRLRERPDSYRRKVSVVVALLITLLIFAVWLSVTVSSLNSGEEEILKVDEIDSPVVSFKKTFEGFFDDFKAGLEGLFE